MIEYDNQIFPCQNCNENPKVKNNFQSKDKYYPLVLNGDHIHLWSEDGSYKWTVALFTKDKDDFWNLEFISDRALEPRVDWRNFETLIRLGFEIRGRNEE